MSSIRGLESKTLEVLIKHRFVMYVQISIQATTHDDNHATYLTVGTENATSTERYTC